MTVAVVTSAATMDAACPMSIDVTSIITVVTTAMKTDAVRLGPSLCLEFNVLKIH